MLPRSFLALSLSIALPLVTGACGVPMAVTASSYAVDGGLMATTNKTSTDHLLSMTTKQDCSLWRVFRHQVVCKDRPDGKDPYHVNYDEPFNMGPDGFGPPLHAPAGAPARSWDEAAYKAPTPPPQQPSEPTRAIAETAPPPAAAAAAPPAPAKKKVVGRAKVKKPSPRQVASAR